MNVGCALNCGRPLNPHDIGVWKEVRGFVGGPKKDAMTLREDTGRYAHDSCVRAASTGTAPDTPELVADETTLAGDKTEWFADGTEKFTPAADNTDIKELEGMLGDDSR